jgi:hypothetical protein
MFSKTLFLSVLSIVALIAHQGNAAEQRHAEAHVHGTAEINIVVEGKKIVVEFHTPTEGVMGFEHEARTDVEKKKRDAAMKIINDRFNDLVAFDRKAACKLVSAKAQIMRDTEEGSKDKTRASEHRQISGEHSEVRAVYQVECERSPAGTKVTFGISKLFPDIHEVKVQVLTDSKQSGVTIKNDRGAAEL